MTGARKFTKRGKCRCGAPCVFRPTEENQLLGQWVHVDGKRQCKDGEMCLAESGSVTKVGVEDVQVTQGRL